MSANQLLISFSGKICPKCGAPVLAWLSQVPDEDQVGVEAEALAVYNCASSTGCDWEVRVTFPIESFLVSFLADIPATVGEYIAQKEEDSGLRYLYISPGDRAVMIEDFEASLGDFSPPSLIRFLRFLQREEAEEGIPIDKAVRLGLVNKWNLFEDLGEPVADVYKALIDRYDAALEEPAQEPAGPSPDAVAEAVETLTKELESPEFAAALGESPLPAFAERLERLGLTHWPGEEVLIYEDPLTELEPEGYAVLMGWTGIDGADLEVWEVAFEDDGLEETFRRKIKPKDPELSIFQGVKSLPFTVEGLEPTHKPGDRLRIYKDPLAETGDDGEAVLVEFFEASQDLELWGVRFPGYPDYMRTIKRKTAEAPKPPGPKVEITASQFYTCRDLRGLVELGDDGLGKGSEGTGFYIVDVEDWLGFIEMQLDAHRYNPGEFERSEIAFYRRLRARIERALEVDAEAQT